MDLFNDIQNWAWSNIMVAFATFILAWLTWLLYRETAKTRHHNQSAEVVINFEIHPRYNSAMNLIIENIGLGLAKNIFLKLNDSDFKIELKNGEPIKMNEWSFFKQKIPILKSKQQIKHYSFMYHHLKNPENVNFKVQVEWENYDGTIKTNEAYLDVSFYQYLSIFGNDPLHEIANIQKKISDNLNKIVNGKMIKVEMITHLERKQQDSETHEKHKIELQRLQNEETPTHEP